MQLKGKTVAVFVDTLYQEMEAWYPYYRLKEAGADVVVVAAEAPKTYTSKLGYPMRSDITYDAALPARFDGLIIPGGYAPDHMRRHPAAVDFVKEMNAAGKLVASICHGPWLMCSAGILKGRHATSFFAIKDDVVNAGAIWEDRDVVVDRNLVTSRTPEDLPAFMKAAISVLVS